LGDRTTGARVEFALEIVEVIARAERSRMSLGIGRNGDFEIRDTLKTGDKV
jgi:hypothetical protein